MFPRERGGWGGYFERYKSKGGERPAGRNSTYQIWRPLNKIKTTSVSLGEKWRSALRGGTAASFSSQSMMVAFSFGLERIGANILLLLTDGAEGSREWAPKEEGRMPEGGVSQGKEGTGNPGLILFKICTLLSVCKVWNRSREKTPSDLAFQGIKNRESYKIFRLLPKVHNIQLLQI